MLKFSVSTAFDSHFSVVYFSGWVMQQGYILCEM